MLFTEELLDRAQEIVDGRRKAAEDLLEARLREFEKTEPRYTELKAELIGSVQEALKSVDMDRQAAEVHLVKQRARNLAAQQELYALLEAHGLPRDYLETPYACKKCSDTGAVGTKLCSCVIEELQKLAFEDANKDSPLRFSTFEEFRLDYYSDKYVKEYECSPRERMAEILALCKAYAADFDTSSQSLFLCGGTGLGKTHLSLAIAGEVIKKGYKVLYNSAQNIFNNMQKEYFSKEHSGQYESLVLECDLLILDDLGAEFQSNYTNAALYNIINTRLNKGLPTIINTNLSNKQIEDRYTQRISSRIIGDYVRVRFIGDDIRQIKAGQ